MSTIRQHSEAYHFDVVYFLSHKSHLSNELKAMGCTVTCLHSENVFEILFKLPKLYRLIKENKYDLLHAHLPWSGIIARVVGKIIRVPVVYTEHNLFSRYNIFTRIFSTLTFGWQAQVIAVSDEVSSVLRKEIKPRVPVRTIMNAVDTKAFDTLNFNVGEQLRKFNLPENGCIIGTVTALTQQKRIDRWIRIASQVTERVNDVFFVIVGDGTLRNELEASLQKSPAKNKIWFAGLSSEPGSWLACMDIFLLSSDFEGLPVALLEAMSMKCVPVATRVGGIPDVIDHGRNGFLYDAKDEATAVNEIVDLVNDSEKRIRMGAEARKTIEEKYSIERMVKELEEVYEEIGVRSEK